MDKTPQRKPVGHNIDGIMRSPRSPHHGQLAAARFARPPYGKRDSTRVRKPGFRNDISSPVRHTPPRPVQNSQVSLPPIRPTRTPTHQKLPSLSGLNTKHPQPSTQPPSQPTPELSSVRPHNLPRPTATVVETKRGKRNQGKKRFWHKFVPKNPRTRKILKYSTITLAAIVILSGGYLGWKVWHDTGKVFGSNSALLGFLSATPLKCENTGRCNILLAGNSADDPGHGGANLTDSIMIISIDMKTKNAMLISVPRDLYVQVPNYGGHTKINAIYPDGEADNFSEAGYAKGGMGLLEKTISQDFGIPVSYYALIDYSALREAVNTVGGITVNIQSSDPRGLYDPSIDYATNGPLVKLTNGEHTLNGEQALDLARARGDTYGAYGFAQSDFERTQNQRLMMLALKTKVTSSSTLANPVKLGQLFDAFGSNVHTDLQPGNVRRLYDLFKNVPNSDIKSIGLNSVTLSGKQNVNLLASYSAPGGQDALIPAAGVDNYTQIQLFLKQLTSNNAVLKEAANVVVLNAGNTQGLGAAEANLLTSKGMNVLSTANAPSSQANTIVVDNSGGKYPATLAELKTLYGQNVGSNPVLVKTYPTAQFIVVLGQNQQMPSSQ